jgi:hypothetical protein
VAVRLTKPWLTVHDALAKLHGHLGVFELADEDNTVIYIGFAGGRSQFGLKAEVDAAVHRIPEAAKVRYEVTSAYHTRYRELLMVHQADFGQLPQANPPIKLGTLSPA